MSIDLLNGGRLLLAGGGRAWVWLVLAGVLVGLLVVLYREERRLVTRGVGLVLLALRLLAAAVLVAALFEPIAAWTRVETIRGRVVVAADVSESMATKDADRTDGLTRLGAARRLVEGATAPLAKLDADHDVAALTFAREGSADGTLPVLSSALAQAGKPDDPARLTSDPGPAFESALRSSDTKPVLGLVLLTDGRFNAPGGDPTSQLDRLKARGIPVFPVLIGSTKTSKDLAIAAIKAPESVYLGDIATIDAIIKVDGVEPGRAIRVTLRRPAGAAIEKTVTVPADGGRPVASFRLPLEKTGATPITLAVETLDGEIRTDNNERTLTIQVADDKASVLLVDGEARWEFRYLRNALARDPRVKLEAVLLRQPSPTGSIEASYPTTLPPLPADPGTPDPLSRFDLIVLGDLTASEATSELWDRMGKYVGERGGSLVLLPGPRGWPAVAATNEVARALVPLIDPHLIPPDKTEDVLHPSLPPGARIVPVAAILDDAATWPMLQLGGDTIASRGIWSGLPRMPWALGGAPKPTATALVSSTDGATIIASQPYGLGKILYLGTDATWRWRHGVGDLYHHRFWGQVVRWASMQGLSAGDRYVKFGPTRPKVGEGEPATIRARLSEAVPNVGPGTLLAARIYKAGGSPDQASAVIPLRLAPGQSRMFEGVAPGLGEGSYLVRLDAPGLPSESPGKPPEATLAVTQRDTSERIELAAARDPLERLAAATGGKVFDETTAADLPSLLKSRVRTESKTQETPLWDHPYALILFFTVLTLEWVIRRRVGLP